MMSQQYVVINNKIALFLHLHIWKTVPFGVYRWTHALGGGGKRPCLAHSVCAALHGRGLWENQSQKKYSF